LAKSVNILSKTSTKKTMQETERSRNHNKKFFLENIGQKIKFLAHSDGWIVLLLIFDVFSVTLYRKFGYRQSG
jgi:hypothetical protein